MNDQNQYQIRQSLKLALPNGLQELLSDISREVLRSQPNDVCNFITEYLGALLEARDKLAVASQICDEVCHSSCQPELEEELRDIGLSDEEVKLVGKIVEKYFEEGQSKKVHDTLLYELSKKIDVDDSVLEAVMDAVMVAFRRNLLKNAVKYEINSSENPKDDRATKAVKHTVLFYENEMCKVWDHESEKPKEYEHDENEIEYLNEGREENERSTSVSSMSLAGSYVDLPKHEPYVATEGCYSNTTVDECPETTQHKYEETEVTVGTAEEKEKNEERHEKISLLSVSSMSLAGSFVTLPKHVPYAATESGRHLSTVDESPEKEQMNLDYTIVCNKYMSENGYGVQVVTVEADHSYSLNVTELEEVLMKPEIKELPVVVISVAGAYRGGKSFLLNFFLKYLRASSDARLNGKWLETGDEPLTGFSWRGGSTRNTTGILIWSEPMIATISTGEKFAILLMDTQGTFDSTSSMKDCSTVFALSTLLSSVQIYNLSMKIQEDNLQHLQLFTEYGKLIKEKSGKPFQVLEFLVRDWMVPYEFDYGAKGGQLYLKQQLEITPKLLPELRELRQQIKSSFESVTCFLMPHPGFAVMNPKFTGSVNEISQDFLNALKELVPSLFSEAKLKVKQVNGQPVKAKELFEYFKTYMKLFNSGKIPTPTSILKATSEAGFLLAVNEARELYESNMTAACGGDAKSVPALDVQQQHRLEVSNALGLFNNKKKLGSPEDNAKYLEILTKGLNDREKEYLTINMGKTQKLINEAKHAYDEEVVSIAKGQPLCVHALDLQKVHNDALKAGLNKFDSNRKLLSGRTDPDRTDPDRKSLEKDLSERYILLRITNEQNNKLAKSELKDEYWQFMMVKVLEKPSLTEDQFAEEHKKAVKRALEQFDSRRSMANEYTEDSYKYELQKELEFSYVSIKQINSNANKESFQIAIIVFNENIVKLTDIRKHCLHPQALQEEYDEAVCSALKAFRPTRSCGQGFNNSDRDEALILSIFQNRFEALNDINRSANEIAVHSSFETFKSEYIYLRAPSWWWLLIIPIFQTKEHYEQAKELGLETFRNKRRDRRNYGSDVYLTDLENKMWNWYNS